MSLDVYACIKKENNIVYNLVVLDKEPPKDFFSKEFFAKKTSLDKCRIGYKYLKSKNIFQPCDDIPEDLPL